MAIERREALAIGPGDLLVFADETGDLVLGEYKAKVFGLAAALLRYEDYDAHAARWRAAKAKIFGAEDAPFHASANLARFAPHAAPIVSEFFTAATFRRLAVTHSYRVPTVVDAGPWTAVVECFLGLLMVQATALIQEAGVLPSRLLLIFEHNEKLVPHLQRLANGARIKLRSEGETRVLPTEFAFLRKTSGEVGLEWADAIGHRASRRSRGRLDGEAASEEFAAVFPPGTLGRGEWRDIDEVRGDTATCWSVWGGHHWAAFGDPRVDVVHAGAWFSVVLTRVPVRVSRDALVRIFSS